MILKELLCELRKIRKALQDIKHDLERFQKGENYLPLSKSLNDQLKESSQENCQKKEFDALKHRVEQIENGDNTILTAEYGKKTLKFYIRLMCSGKDPRQNLKSFEN